MAGQFNAPPGWPAAQPGWTPPAGWKPDPSWPPAPEGWNFWPEDSTGPAGLPSNPRALAKADKAYRKAMRPWYAKKRFWFLGLVGFIIVASVIANGSGGSTPSAAKQPSNQSQAAPKATVAPKATTQPKAAAPKPAAEAADPSTLADNGWNVTTFTTKDDGVGDFGATARIVNGTGSDNATAVFTMTVLDKSKNIVATLVGSANSVGSGKTVTVQFVSTDKFKAGTFLYAFQVDMSS